MMEMINRCLEISDGKRAALEAFDRHAQRKEMIANRIGRREQSDALGNRKWRRRQAALARRNKETV